MLEAIKNRRLISTYINKDAEGEKIIQFLKSVMQAPSSRNSSCWEFIDEFEKNKIHTSRFK